MTTTATLTLELTPAELEELRIAVTIPGWENDDWQSVKRKVLALVRVRALRDCKEPRP